MKIAPPQPKKVEHLGTLPLHQIHAVVRRHQPNARYCYLKELHKDPTIVGRVTMGFVVEESGEVTRAKVKQTSLNNSAVESCLVEATLSMVFPKPQGGSLEVSYPYLFEVTNRPRAQKELPADYGSTGTSQFKGGDLPKGLPRRVELQVGGVVILGSLDRGNAEHLIVRGQPELQRCYGRSRKDGGRVTVELLVAKDGHVETATVDSSTLNSAPVEFCIIRHMQRLRFSTHSTAKITVPLYYSR